MTILYKLTDEHDRTHGGCQWGEGVEHVTDGHGNLCGPGFTHWYTDPLLAVLLNPIHANFQNPHLWEGEGDVAKTARGLKVGCTRGKTLKRLPLPEISLTQRVVFGILCAKTVYTDTAWNKWANDWLSGVDRTRAAATAAADAAYAADAAAYAASHAASHAASYAASHSVYLDLIAVAHQALAVEP